MTDSITLQIYPEAGERLHFQGTEQAQIQRENRAKGCLSLFPFTSSKGKKQEIEGNYEGHQEIVRMQGSSVIGLRILYDHYREKMSAGAEDLVRGKSIDGSLIEFTDEGFEVLEGNPTGEDLVLIESKSNRKFPRHPYGFNDVPGTSRTVEQGDTFRASDQETELLKNQRDSIVRSAEDQDREIIIERASMPDGNIEYKVREINSERVRLELSGDPVIKIRYTLDGNMIEHVSNLELDNEIEIDRDRMRIRSTRSSEVRKGVWQKSSSIRKQTRIAESSWEYRYR